MLKLPKVTMETMEKISNAVQKKENEEQEEVTQRMQDWLEEFASEQPALMTMISRLGELKGEPNVSIAMVVYKIIKTECENSELKSFMDVK